MKIFLRPKTEDVSSLTPDGAYYTIHATFAQVIVVGPLHGPAEYRDALNSLGPIRWAFMGVSAMVLPEDVARHEVVLRRGFYALIFQNVETLR